MCRTGSVEIPIRGGSRPGIWLGRRHRTSPALIRFSAGLAPLRLHEAGYGLVLVGPQRIDRGQVVGQVVTQQDRRALSLDISEVRPRSEEHTSELQSLMRISYAVFCLKKQKHDSKKA